MTTTTRFSAPLPPVKSTHAIWPSSVSPIEGLNVPGVDDALISLSVDGRWFSVRRDDDNHLETFVTDDEGARVESPWDGATTADMIPLALALREDLDSHHENLRNNVDALASNLGLELAVPTESMTGGGVLRATDVPVIPEVPHWNFDSIPYPDRARLDSDSDAVIFNASFRTISVQGEIVTEKDQLVVLTPEELAVVVAWAEAFREAHKVVTTMLVHNIETASTEWIKGKPDSQLN